MYVDMYIYYMLGRFNQFTIACLSYTSFVDGQEKIRNRTGPAEPNRTDPLNFGNGRNRTQNRTEPNRTEPPCVRKTQAEPHRTGKNNCPEPNRTEPMNLRKVRHRNESNRTGSFLYVCMSMKRAGRQRRARSRRNNDCYTML